VPIIDRPEDERRLIYFLLGRSLPGEREEIEQQCMDDPAFLERLEAIESELIEEYLEGGLTAEERRAFESQYMRNPERRRKVDLAKALNRRLEPSQRRSAPAWVGRLALASVALIAVAASLLYYSVRPAAPFVLVPGGVERSGQETGQVIAPSRMAPAVEIHLDLNGTANVAVDRASLRTVEEETPVWVEKIRQPANRSFLDLVIQNSVLEDRDYILTLESGNNAVLSYSFRVHKK